MALKSSNGSSASVVLGSPNLSTGTGGLQYSPISIWIKVDSWDSADQLIMSYEPASLTGYSTLNNFWELRRVGTTDAIQVVNIPASGSPLGPMPLSSIGAIAGTGWHNLIILGFIYAWDGTIYNSDQTYGPSLNENVPLTIYPNTNLAISQVALVPRTAFTDYTHLDSYLSPIAAVLSVASGPVALLANQVVNDGLTGIYWPIDSPLWASGLGDYGPAPTSVSSNTEYFYGPPISPYRTAICNETSMAAYFPFDDAAIQVASGNNSYYTGPVVKDCGGANRGFVSDDDTPPTAGPPASATIEGSFQFVNTGFDPVEVDDSSSIDFTGAFSVEAWIYPSAGRINVGQIVAKRCSNSDVAPYYDYSLALDTSGHIVFSIAIGSTQYSVTSATVVSASTWTHVAGVYTGSALEIYIGSTLDSNTTSVSGTVKTSGMPLCIGGPGSSYFTTAGFAGGITSVALYNAALTSTNFAAHMAAAGSAGDPGPATNVRVTQFVDEVLYQGGSNARVTQYTNEVLYAAKSNSRVTQYVLEVLRSADVPTGSSYTKSASSTLNLHVAATEIDSSPIHNVGATTGLHLGAATTEVVSVGRLAAAASTFQFQTVSIPIVGHPRPVSAASHLVLATNARDPDNTNVLVSAATTLSLGSIGDHQEQYAVSASSSFNLASRSSDLDPTVFNVAATNTLIFTASRTTGTVPVSRFVAARESFTFGDFGSIYNTSSYPSANPTMVLTSTASSAATIRNHPVAASVGFEMGSSSGSGGTVRNYPVYATTNVKFGDLGNEARNAHWSVNANGGFKFADLGSEIHAGVQAVVNTMALSSLATVGRDVFVSATTNVGLAPAPHTNPYYQLAATTSLAIEPVAGPPGIVPLGANPSLQFVDRASSILALPSGGGVPGQPAGSPQGLRNLLRSGGSGQFPDSFAETPSGLVLIANGVDPMLRWDAQAGLVDTAGVQPPSVACLFGGTGVGTIIGERQAYVRFLDQYGNVSVLSPVSNTVEFGFDGWIDSMTIAANGTITITSEAHGLASGEAILISGVLAPAIVNGMRTITVTDPNTFTLNGLVVPGGQWTGGGYWVYGVSNVVYSDVPVPTETKVVRRQLLRNLNGNGDVFYVDVDTTDLTSTAFVSTLSDELLSANEPVAIQFEDDLPAANRYYPPPSSKSVIAAHMGRIFATCDVTVSVGVVMPILGSTLVQGYGTRFSATFAGRNLFVYGASQAYEIASVNVATQTLTLVNPYTDAATGLQTYAIRAPLGERKFVYYSEPNLPEAWPPWNAIAVVEDGDNITGLMVMDSFLFILESRNIYKYTLQSDPATDGFLFLATRRGCLNSRCFVQVENNAYLLDDVGIHKFDGGQSTAISTPIQSVFQRGVGLGGVEVNWGADQTLWHAALDPVRETIRWFVSMTGEGLPRHAICYDYRRDRWWIEEYPYPITSNVVSTIDYRRSLVGSDAGRVLCLSEGTLDVADASVGGLGTVTSAGPLLLADATTPFVNPLAGATVSIASGKGRGQQRRITGNTTGTLAIDRPWLVIPDATSTYQVGGVNWSWRSGWFRYVEDESENPRDVELIFQPTKQSASLDVELFYDHHDCPVKWGYSQSQDGVSTTVGSSLITIDLATRSGYAIQRMSGHRAMYANGDRFVSAMLSGVQGPEPTRLYQLTLNGAE